MLGYPTNLVRPCLDMVQISATYILILSISIAVAWEYIARKDTENAINL